LQDLYDKKLSPKIPVYYYLISFHGLVCKYYEIFRILVELWELGKVPACLLQQTVVTCAFDFLAELGCLFWEGRSGNSGGEFFLIKKKLCFRCGDCLLFFTKSFDLQSSHCYFSIWLFD
jgi:hypothetical protein